LPESILEGCLQRVRDVKGHVESHLIHQREGTDRKAKLDHGVVNVTDRPSLLENCHCLVQHESEDPARVEPRTIADDDHMFAEPPPKVNGRGDGLI